jgi:hypothetical protein
MLSLSIGKNYCLRLADGRPLGHVRITQMVDSWAEGPFSPEPTFEQFKELFAREARLRKDQIIPLWEEAADAIEALGIEVIEEGGSSAKGPMRVFVEGNEAILGPDV